VAHENDGRSSARSLLPVARGEYARTALVVKDNGRSVPPWSQGRSNEFSFTRTAYDHALRDVRARGGHGGPRRRTGSARVRRRHRVSVGPNPSTARFDR